MGLLRYARDHAPAGMVIELADLSEMPFYNADITEKPAAVTALFRQMNGANAFLFGCAEYNYSVAPALKNALDWASREPENRLLARGPRFRLPAFAIRDQALAASGLLVEEIGGESVKPYMPPRIWNSISNNRYEQDHGSKLYRRSLYTYWRRTIPPPTFSMKASPRARPSSIRVSVAASSLRWLEQNASNSS